MSGQNQEEKLACIISLIQKDRIDEAAKLYLAVLEKDISLYLKHWFYWDEYEVKFLIHDAFILIARKVKEGEIRSINKSYVQQVCKNLGARTYVKIKKNKEKYSTYIEELRRDYQKQKQDYCHIELYPDVYSVDEKKALRIFNLLDEKCQELIKLKLVKGLSHKQVAEKIPQVKNSNVARTLLSRCMQKLKMYKEKINA